MQDQIDELNARCHALETLCTTLHQQLASTSGHLSAVSTTLFGLLLSQPYPPNICRQIATVIEHTGALMVARLHNEEEFQGFQQASHNLLAALHDAPLPDFAHTPTPYIWSN